MTPAQKPQQSSEGLPLDSHNKPVKIPPPRKSFLKGRLAQGVSRKQATQEWLELEMEFLALRKTSLP